MNRHGSGPAQVCSAVWQQTTGTWRLWQAAVHPLLGARLCRARLQRVEQAQEAAAQLRARLWTAFGVDKHLRRVHGL